MDEHEKKTVELLPASRFLLIGNDFFDYVLPKLNTGSRLNVYLAIFERCYWDKQIKKEPQPFTHQEIMLRTGLTRNPVRNALSWLDEHGYILTYIPEEQPGKGKCRHYTINQNLIIEEKQTTVQEHAPTGYILLSSDKGKKTAKEWAEKSRADSHPLERADSHPSERADSARSKRAESHPLERAESHPSSARIPRAKRAESARDPAPLFILEESFKESFKKEEEIWDEIKKALQQQMPKDTFERLLSEARLISTNGSWKIGVKKLAKGWLEGRLKPVIEEQLKKWGQEVSIEFIVI